MSSKKGWIKLHRDIVEHWVYQDPLLLQMWITLLCFANYEPKDIVINNQKVHLNRGQFWTSIRKLAIITGMTRKTVEAKLNLLQSDGMIYVDSWQGVGTLVTVRNYGLYQGFSEGVGDTQGDTAGDTQGDTEETLRGTPNTHNLEDKHYKALQKKEKKLGASPGADPKEVWY